MSKGDAGDGLAVAGLVLRAASQVVQQIQQGIAASGFTDVRPAHGFAFVQISAGNATMVELAAHLGVSKQAASQLVAQLVERGYVTREADPSDRRARLLQLTERGWACTRAAERAAGDVAAEWEQQLRPARFAALQQALDEVVVAGPIRPAW